jgi:hypothetical protein
MYRDLTRVRIFSITLQGAEYSYLYGYQTKNHVSEQQGHIIIDWKFENRPSSIG